MLRVASIVLIAGLLGTGSTPAAAFYELSGVFIADQRCQAFDSIRRQTNPGNVLTVAGQSYNARALNREDGDYVYIDVPGASPRARWVSVMCGDLFRGADHPDPDAGTPAGFTPFFDADDRPNDPTPRPPTLSAFDQAMLEVCGNWGSRPTAAAFRAKLDEPALAGDVDRIYRALDGSILGERREPRQFKDELATVWFGQDGFRHIFCGEPSEQTIGGLHFVGRYLQMQEQGWGGMAAQCNATEIAPPVYTFGVRFRTPSGRVRTACPKGYALNLDAGAILIEATKAFKLMLPRSSGSAMCLYQVAQPSVSSYFAVFVIKSEAVRTFYPDASPSCDRGRPVDSCLCER
ncbi:MAG TPA: EndoU domain-containing protein [Xanthobacteraceae bacterium]|nr:EndoU domain-containing protein [Xanthobacteraceae bacterium]